MAEVTKTLSLDEFLNLPETEPASEFIDGKVIQKDMPQGEHSRLQSKLCSEINRVAEAPRIAYAFPELRCSFSGNSIIPDIAVFRWNRIPREPSGRVANHFLIPPDWAIEILSPNQSSTKVLGRLLYCSEHETELGWLIDPAEESVLVVLTEQRVRLLQRDTSLPVLNGIELELTVEKVFDWLIL